MFTERRFHARARPPRRPCLVPRARMLALRLAVPGPIFYTRSADSSGAAWPEGVGITFKGGDVIRVELHYLNLTAADTNPEVKLDVWYGAITSEAGSLFMYDRDIAIPAHGKFTA